MTTSQLVNIDNAELKTHATLDGNGISVRFAGCADNRVMSPIGDLLKSVHAEALARKTAEVVIDLRELEFMNSSCFKAFVTWLGAVQDLEPAAQYRICFLSDDGKHWQRRSLSALSCFAVNLIRIET